MKMPAAVMAAILCFAILTMWVEEPERCRLASQFAPLLPGTRYRVRFEPVDAARAPEWGVLDLMYQRRQRSTRLEATVVIAGAVLEWAR